MVGNHTRVLMCELRPCFDTVMTDLLWSQTKANQLLNLERGNGKCNSLLFTLDSLYADYHFMGATPSAWLADSTRLDQLCLEVDTSHIETVCKIFSRCSLRKLRLLTITLRGVGLKGIPKERFWLLGRSVGMAINLDHILEICVQVALSAPMGASVFYHLFTGFGDCSLAHIKCASKKLIYEGIDTLPPLIN